jgi:hypothetical protein
MRLDRQNSDLPDGPNQTVIRAVAEAHGEMQIPRALRSHAIRTTAAELDDVCDDGIK